MPRLQVLALLLVLSACGEEGGGMTEPDPSESPATSSELLITVQVGPDSPAESWTLTCDPPGGTHRDAEAACRALENARRDPFAPVPSGMQCTQVYGGPQTASITGTWLGRTVHASYRRTDGCEIARWAAIGDVLGPGGA